MKRATLLETIKLLIAAIAFIFIVALVVLIVNVFSQSDDNTIALQTIVGETQDGLYILELTKESTYEQIFPMAVATKRIVVTGDGGKQVCLREFEPFIGNPIGKKIHCLNAPKDVRFILTDRNRAGEGFVSGISPGVGVLLNYKLTIRSDPNSNGHIAQITPEYELQ